MLLFKEKWLIAFLWNFKSAPANTTLYYIRLLKLFIREDFLNCQYFYQTFLKKLHQFLFAMRAKLTKCWFLDVSNFCYVHKENLDSLSYQTSTFVQKEIYVVIMWKVYENCIFWKSEVIPSSWWLLRETTHKRKEQKLQPKNHNNKRATVCHCPSLHLQFEKVLSVLDKTKSEHEICKSSKV